MSVAKTAIGIVALVALGACAHGAGRTELRPAGGLVLHCEPPDAEILLDDQYVGTAVGFAGRPIRLPAGLVRLELRREGYFSVYHELRVVEGLRQTLSVQLRRRPF